MESRNNQNQEEFVDELAKQIQDKANIVEVIGRYIPLVKKGNNFVGVCPFHDDTKPSLSVTLEKRLFNCFACGQKGNVIQFVQKYENISYKEAKFKLAREYNIEFNDNTSEEEKRAQYLQKILEDACAFYQFYLKQTEEGTEGLKYLSDRFINEDIIKEFKIGLSPSHYDELYKFLTEKKGYLELDLLELGLVTNTNGSIHDTFRSRIMFPLTNQFGKVVGFSGRKFLPKDINNVQIPKYLNSNDNEVFHKGEVLYHFDEAKQTIRQKDKVYILEGFMDVIAACKAGIKNSVAAMGTAFTRYNAQSLLSLTKNIVLCFDGDEAGIEAMCNATKVLTNFNVIPYAVVLPDGLDPDEYLNKYSAKELVNYLENNSFSSYEWMYTLAKKSLIKGDFTSQEKFKKAVFNFLKITTESTIHEHFIQTLAIDLEIDADALRKDFKFFNPTNNYKNNNRTNNNYSTISNTQKNKGIKSAYEILIKCALSDPQVADDYFENVGICYIDSFAIEYSILSLIHSLNQSEKDLDFILKQLEANEIYKKYIDNINCLIDNLLIKKTIEDCINKINDFIKKSRKSIACNIFKSGDDSIYKELVMQDQNTKAENKSNEK